MYPIIFILLIAFVVLATSLIIPYWITSDARADEEHDEKLEGIIRNPRVKRTILRIEVGGIIIGVAAILFSVFGLIEAVRQSQFAKDALKNQKIASAWQLLAQTGQGSTGKGYALEILVSETTATLSGLNLGCTSKLIEDDENKGTHEACELPNVFSNLKLSGNEERRSEILKSDFSYSFIEESSFKNVNFSEVNFDYSILIDVQISNSMFSGSLKKAEIISSEFKNVLFMSTDFTAEYNDVEINNSALLNAVFMTDADSRGDPNNSYQSMLLSNVHIGRISFENSSLVRSGIDIENPVYTKDQDYRLAGVEYPEGGYSTNSMINISGATICEIFENKKFCWDGATPEFFEHSWFYEDNPPKGIELLSFKPQLGKPCSRENVTLDKGYMSYREGESCLDRFLRNY